MTSVSNNTPDWPSIWTIMDWVEYWIAEDKIIVIFIISLWEIYFHLLFRKSSFIFLSWLLYLYVSEVNWSIAVSFLFNGVIVVECVHLTTHKLMNFTWSHVGVLGMLVYTNMFSEFQYENTLFSFTLYSCFKYCFIFYIVLKYSHFKKT